MGLLCGNARKNIGNRRASIKIAAVCRSSKIDGTRAAGEKRENSRERAIYGNRREARTIALKICIFKVSIHRTANFKIRNAPNTGAVGKQAGAETS